jgi:hypothetical protein
VGHAAEHIAYGLVGTLDFEVFQVAGPLGFR